MVISNNPGAYALERARNHSIESVCMSPREYESREAFNQAFLAKVDAYRLDLIVLAGFLVKIPEAMVEKYEHRIINIHPSLIPPSAAWDTMGLRFMSRFGKRSKGYGSYGPLCRRRYGYGADHFTEGGRGGKGRYAPDATEKGNGAGGVGNSSKSDSDDR